MGLAVVGLACEGRMPGSRPENPSGLAEPVSVVQGEPEGKPQALGAPAKPSVEANGGTEKKPQAPASPVSAAQAVPKGYVLSGPDSGEVGRTVTFKVTLDPEVHPPGIVRLTPSASNGDGTFSLAFLDLHEAARSGEFSYTPTRPGARTIAITNIGGLKDPPPFSFLSKAHKATTYFISPKSTSGSGTRDDPFGLPDLLNTKSTPVSQGPALTILMPGDTLEFRGGTYNLAGSPDAYTNQLICPTISGTASAPITIQAYPGESVIFNMTAGKQPAFGTASPTLSYVRFLGFKVVMGTTIQAGGAWFLGTNNEVGYCEFVGNTTTVKDNYPGIRIDPGAVNIWVHHNFIHGFHGPDSTIGLGIQSFGGSQLLVEDNYCTDNAMGINEKWASNAGNDQNIYRRNWLVNNTHFQWSGPFIGGTQTDYIYDNMLDGYLPLDLGQNMVNTQVYNNFLRSLASAAGGQVIINNGAKMINDASYNTATQVVQTNFWNNIMFQGGSIGVEAYHTYEPYNQTGPSAPFAYSDYNIYDGAPGWDFGNGTRFNLAQFRAQGFERHSRVVRSARDIFQDRTSYQLKPQWQTAGRYGDPVGPRFPIAQIIDARRYGPRALRTGTSPSIIQQPRNQTVSVGETATFSVEVTGSGLCYQWQGSRTRGATWVNIRGANWGANSPVFTYRPSSTTDSGAVFRCLVSCSGGSVWSDPVTITITDPAVALPIRTQPSSRTGTARPEGSKPFDRGK
jgi:hypothetical protein